MTLPAWIAAIVLFLQLPIPLYWFVVHPQVKFWRRYPRAVYVVGLASSWLPVTIAMVAFHRRLFRPDWPSVALFALGLALIIFECWIFWRVHHDLGTSRLVGKTELSGAGKIQREGIYGQIRHPTIYRVVSRNSWRLLSGGHSRDVDDCGHVARVDARGYFVRRARNADTLWRGVCGLLQRGAAVRSLHREIKR